MPGAEPRSVYGRTKLAGELATLEQGGIVVRVSALYDAKYTSHKGKAFPDTITTSFDAITLPTDQRFSPTYAPDAADRIANLTCGMANGVLFLMGETNAYDGKPTGIYHAANAGSTSWAEFAEQIIEVLPWRRLVVPHKAHDRLRPTNSLRSTRLPPLRHWVLGLHEWADARRASVLISPTRTPA
jgi:dTDP-4-dehydrorhamnose reductase